MTIMSDMINVEPNLVFKQKKPAGKTSRKYFSYYNMNLSVKEVAEILNLSYGGAYDRLRKSGVYEAMSEEKWTYAESGRFGQSIRRNTQT